MSREKFHVTIYVEKSERKCFAGVKYGNIMSGFGKCCDYLESHLLCDLAKVLTDKSQVCLVEPVFDTRILFAKRKNAS